MARTTRIYATLDDQEVNHQATLVEIEGKVSDASISILIDPVACRRYVSLKIVDTCKLNKEKHEKLWLVQLATGTKRNVSELVKYCKIDMSGFPAKVDLNRLPLGSYDVLICMCWLEQHHVMLDCLNKSILCTDNLWNQRKI